MSALNKSRQMCLGIAIGVMLCFFVYNVCLERKTNIQPRVVTFTKVSTNAVTETTPTNMQRRRRERTKFIYVMDILHKERIAALRRSCLRSKTRLNKMAVNSNALYSKTYKFAVCDIQKCGSSSWLQALMVMEKYFKPEDYFANRIVGQEVMNLGNQNLRISSFTSSSFNNWQKAMKIITVRHPFARIVSAYNDKMALNGPGSTPNFYKPMSHRISKKYREMRHNPAERNHENGGAATFEDFVNFLVKSPYPTDSHWIDFELSCHPCTFQYDVVVKFESLVSDISYLEEKLNITVKDRKVFFPNRNSRTQLDVVEKMFKSVPKNLALQLYYKYETDFDRFGYERPHWLD